MASILDNFILEIKDLVSQGMSNREIANLYLTSEKSIRRFKKRHGINGFKATKATTKVDQDKVEITVPVAKSPPLGVHMDDPERMLKERNLNPDEWEVDSATINEWDGPQQEGGVVTYHQAKLHLKRKKNVKDTILPARSEGWKAPKRATVSSASAKLVVICGDHHAPFYDPNLHQAFLKWLEDNQPDEGIINGDLLDLPDISRHRNDPENNATINECVQAGYDILRSYVEASPNTHWKMLEGNHEVRLRNWLIDHSKELYGVKQANGKEILTIPFLLRLDELGIEFVEPHGNYDNAKIDICKYLAAKHGDSANKGAGATALKALERYQHNLLVGHVHRQAIVYRTRHKIDGQPDILTACEIGCMCSADQRNDFDGRKFPAYLSQADWQPGFASAVVYPDGLFRLELATYFDGVLLWRDKRYVTK